nr:MAG TPA: hypothetical protein [Caudoviricetes sp.]
MRTLILLLQPSIKPLMIDAENEFNIPVNQFCIVFAHLTS